MKRKAKNRGGVIVGNGVSLMVFQAAKMIFPLITLPYLTRIFSTDVYGVVTYTKAVMNYMQVFVDFGFVLSGTKDVVESRDDKNKLALAAGDTLMARVLLGAVGFVIVVVLSACLPILRENFLFVILSYMAVFLSVFLLDYLFRGLEIMHVITVRFLVMKIISTVLTFVLVKDDSNMILIPVLDILSSVVAIALVFFEVRKRKIGMKVSSLKNIFSKIKGSFVYFLSSAAATSLNAMSTIIIGISASETDVAYWGLVMQVMGTITALYNPISDSLYPEMIKTKKFGVMKKALRIFVPLVAVGCIAAFVMSDLVFKVLGGEEYLAAAPIFRITVPVLFFGFLAVMLGWPVLGPIEKTKEVTISTAVSAIFNVVLLAVLAATDTLNLINLAIARVTTEVLLFAMRFYYVRKYKNLFVDYKEEAKR